MIPYSQVQYAYCRCFCDMLHKSLFVRRIGRIMEPGGLQVSVRNITQTLYYYNWTCMNLGRREIQSF